jgi:ATP adenylyltransferase
MEYIRSAVGEESEGCFLCEKLAAGDDEASYILARRDEAFAILNAFPYNPGHLMVAPRRHVADLEGLDDGEALDCHRLLARSLAVLREEMSPDGFNVGMNLGRVAGAGVPGHLHWHAVPRWNGDTNFMPVTGVTRVLPEALEDTYRKLHPHFE